MAAGTETQDTSTCEVNVGRTPHKASHERRLCLTVASAVTKKENPGVRGQSGFPAENSAPRCLVRKPLLSQPLSAVEIRFPMKCEFHTKEENVQPLGFQRRIFCLYESLYLARISGLSL